MCTSTTTVTRRTFPARGYIDAANEHPVEQIVALSLHWTAVHIVALSAGLHVAAVGAHFGFKALGACFNHTGYDLQVRQTPRWPRSWANFSLL